MSSSVHPLPPVPLPSAVPYRQEQRPGHNAISAPPSQQYATRALNSSPPSSSSNTRPPPIPSSYGSHGSVVSFSSNESAHPGGSGSVNGGTGSRLKALANRRFRKNGSKGDSRDDLHDGSLFTTSPDHSTSVVPTAPASAPAQPQSTSQNGFPLVPPQPEPSLMRTRDRSFSDAEGMVGRGTKSNSRHKIESRIQAFTSNLRKHHAMMSQPPVSPTEGRPTPPPKPASLRAPPSPSSLNSPSLPTSSASPVSATSEAISNWSSNIRPPPTSPTPSSGQADQRTALVPSKTTSTVMAKATSNSERPLLTTTPPSIAALRNSFQMPNTPSISAALHYMRDMVDDRDQEKENSRKDKKEKRRSNTLLRSVPENPPSSLDHASHPSHAEHRGAIPRPGISPSQSKNNSVKRRSASLGDVFKGGWTPAMALAAVGSGSEKGSQPLNAAQAMKNRPPLLHRRSPSNGSASSLERSASNTSPLNPAAANVAATYQYINAELLEDQPSSFVSRRPSNVPPVTDGQMLVNSPSPSQANAHPSQQQPPSLSVTPASAAAPVPTLPPRHVAAIISPPTPQKKPTPADSFSYGSGGESSDAGSSLSGNSRGNTLRNNLKGRLAALSAGANSATASPPLPPRKAPTQNIPPGSYSAPPTGSPTKSNGSASVSSSGAETANTSYSRLRSNSSSNASSSPYSRSNGQLAPPVYNGTRQTYQNVGPGQPTSHLTTPSPHSPAGSLGAAAGVAGGMAMNLGRRGLERVGNLWGHRSAQSGTWATLGGGGYASTGEEVMRGGRNSSEGAGSDSGGYATGSAKGGTRMLGPMLRPPTRNGRGAVFGRSLQECVAETRVTDGRIPDERRRGEGLWVTALVTRCIAHLTHWGLQEEGLFRITGRSTHVAKIRGEFDTGADYDLKEAHPSDLDPHSVSSILKAYLRELPEPILTKKFMPLFDLALSLGMHAQGGGSIGLGVTSFGGGIAFDGNHLPTAEAMKELKALMNQLPRENYDLLSEISRFLRLTAKQSGTTKMPLSNLLLVFCPTLHLNPPFLKLIIERQDYFFGNGEMGTVAPSYEEEELEAPISHALLKGPPLPVSPRPGDQASDDNKRNRTASVVVPGFSVTFEAYAEAAAELASAPIPIRSRTATLASSLHPSPATPASSAPSTPSRSRILPSSNSPMPSPAPSLRSKGAPSTRRQPSLASLFSIAKQQQPAPVISGPIPIVAPTAVQPPVLDVQLPNGSFSVNSALGQHLQDEEREAPCASSREPDSAPNSEEEEQFQLVPGGRSNVPRPAGRSLAMEYSPPPQISMLDTPLKRSTGDGWAAGVLMAAAGDK